MREPGWIILLRLVYAFLPILSPCQHSQEGGGGGGGGGGQREQISPLPFSQKIKTKNAFKLLLTTLIYVLAFLMLLKFVEKLIIRLFDFLSRQKFHFTTSSAYSSSSEVNCKKGWAWMFQFDHSYPIIILATTWS